MERFKTILVLFAVTALVAPAMAADFFIENGATVTGPANLLTGAYNASPDPTAAETFRADYQTLPYDINLSPNPYYVFGGYAGAMPTASDTVRFQQITTSSATIRTNITAGTTYAGDAWYPLDNTTTRIYGDQYVAVRDAGVTFSTDVFNYGRNPAEDFDFAANSLTLPPRSVSFAIRARDAAAITIGELRNLTDDTHVRPSVSSGLPGAYAANPMRTNVMIGNWGNTSTTTTVSIGDMYLNASVTYLHANLGTWNLTGDIKQQGELLMVLWGQANPGGDVRGAINGDSVPTLNIKYSTLLDMIDNGQFYLNLAGGASASLRIGYNFDYDAAITGGAWNAFKITRNDMWQRLSIVSLGDGMVQVHAIPEPATMALLGLGAVALLRRKR